MVMIHLDFVASALVIVSQTYVDERLVSLVSLSASMVSTLFSPGFSSEQWVIEL
jgi:hypothetical protein